MSHIHSAWFDKLTMRERVAARLIGNIAEYSSLQSSFSLMVSLSNHAQQMCHLSREKYG
jgi:hypothetical protein